MSRTTIARRVKFFGKIAKEELHADNLAAEKVFELEFDDMETFEHTKCKPLSVTLAVESETRRILGFQVARMPAKGPLSEKARRKYGYRNDERAARRRQLFESIQPFVAERALIKSDSNPNYPKDVKAYFPTCVHQPYLGKRGAITGQGELKKTRFDPLFSLNHTCAMFRANISRLIRKTWNTTKDPERLADHIAIYCVYHNAHLN